MIYGEKKVDKPIRWAMVGGGKGGQIGYIHRSAALRDNNFQLVAGAFDIDPARGKDFGVNLHVDPERCYPDYETMFEEEAKREDGIQAVSIATPKQHILKLPRRHYMLAYMWYVRNHYVLRVKRQKNWRFLRKRRIVLLGLHMVMQDIK